MISLYDDDELLNTNGEPYFLFKCADVLYGLHALDVYEILEFQHITKVPKLNNYIKGIANIRGNLVCVVDLLQRLDQGATNIDKKTSIVLVRTIQEEIEHTIGIIIDEIFEVDGLDKDTLKETPLFGTKINSKFIRNIAKYNNKEVYILNQDTILDIDDLAQLKGE